MICPDCNIDMIPDEYNEHTYICKDCGQIQHDVEAINEQTNEIEQKREIESEGSNF